MDDITWKARLEQRAFARQSHDLLILIIIFSLILGGWVWFDRAFVICVISLFIWLGSLIFIDVDYGRQNPPRQY